MKPGDVVELAGYGDQRLVRRVVAVRAATVEVCAENDFESVMRGATNRSIGFPLNDVVRVEERS